MVLAVQWMAQLQRVWTARPGPGGQFNQPCCYWRDEQRRDKINITTGMPLPQFAINESCVEGVNHDRISPLSPGPAFFTGATRDGGVLGG